MCYRDRHTALLILLLAISVQPFKVSKNSQNVAYEMIPPLSLSLSLPTSINNFIHLAGITALSSCKHAMLFLQSPFQILERLPAWAGWAFSFCVPAPTRPRPPACLPACMSACRGEPLRILLWISCFTPQLEIRLHVWPSLRKGALDCCVVIMTFVTL